jgi:ATP-dependent helicase/nuclease subunit A
MRAAARRGIRLHALFERLPAVAPERRAAAADAWLEQSEGVADANERMALVDDALTVIEDPSFAPIFGPDALAETPLAGVVGEHVVSGTMDRLLISADEVLVVDFKTGRRVPACAEALSEHHIAQMAAYVAALQGIFPDKAVRAALLYTSGPKLIALPQAMLEAHKPGYRDQQDKLAAAG